MQALEKALNSTKCLQMQWFVIHVSVYTNVIQPRVQDLCCVIILPDIIIIHQTIHFDVAMFPPLCLKMNESGVTAQILHSCHSLKKAAVSFSTHSGVEGQVYLWKKVICDRISVEQPVHIHQRRDGNPSALWFSDLCGAITQVTQWVSHGNTVGSSNRRAHINQ